MLCNEKASGELPKHERTVESTRDQHDVQRSYGAKRRRQCTKKSREMIEFISSDEEEGRAEEVYIDDGQLSGLVIVQSANVTLEDLPKKRRRLTTSDYGNERDADVDREELEDELRDLLADFTVRSGTQASQQQKHAIASQDKQYVDPGRPKRKRKPVFRPGFVETPSGDNDRSLRDEEEVTPTRPFIRRPYSSSPCREIQKHTTLAASSSSFHASHVLTSRDTYMREKYQIDPLAMQTPKQKSIGSQQKMDGTRWSPCSPGRFPRDLVLSLLEDTLVLSQFLVRLRHDRVVAFQRARSALVLFTEQTGLIPTSVEKASLVFAFQTAASNILHFVGVRERILANLGIVAEHQRGYIERLCKETVTPGTDRKLLRVIGDMEFGDFELLLLHDVKIV